MVIETTSAWAPEAAKALEHISRAARGAGSATSLEEACVLVRSWRARAARRRTELVTQFLFTSGSGWSDSLDLCLIDPRQNCTAGDRVFAVRAILSCHGPLPSPSSFTQ